MTSSCFYHDSEPIDQSLATRYVPKYLHLYSTAEILQMKKFISQVLRWYKDHGIKATPVHPKEAFVEEIKTVSSIKELPSPKTTSLSVITPPKVTLGVLKSALMDLNVTGIWLQVSVTKWKQD